MITPVVTGVLRVGIGDLRVGVRHREDDRVLGHRADHLLRDDPADGEADEDVGVDEGVREVAALHVTGELPFIFVDFTVFSTLLGDDPGGVTHRDVLAFRPERDVKPRGRERGRAGTREDDLEVRKVLTDDVGGVDKRRAGDDRRPVLVVVEDRDVHPLAELLFDLETRRRADVFQIDPAEGRLHRGDRVTERVDLGDVEFDVEDVDVGEPFKKDPLALHDRLRGLRADVAEPEHRRPVGDDGDEVPLRRVLEGSLCVLGDVPARRGDARGVRECEVPLGVRRLRRLDLDLSGGVSPVILPGVVV